jgi:hypothetical protein
MVTETVTTQSGRLERLAERATRLSKRTTRLSERTTRLSERTTRREGAGRGRGRPARLAPGVRKLVLTAHVVLSVAWIGLAGCLIALAVVGLDSGEAWAYEAIGVLGGTFLTPLSLGAFVSGVVLSLGTKWGLLRYYWVATKLVITVGLIAATQLALGRFIAEAAELAAAGDPVGELGRSVLGGSIATVVLLVVMTVLSIYKPWGRTSRGNKAIRAGAPS